MLLHQVVFRSGQGALQVLPPLVDVIPEARLNLVIYHLRQGDSLLLCLSYVTQVVCFWFLSSLSLHCYCTVAGWLTLTLCNDALLFIAKDYLPLRSVTVIHIHHWSKGQRFHSLHGGPDPKWSMKRRQLYPRTHRTFGIVDLRTSGPVPY